MAKDLKELYQNKAEELASGEFYDLPEANQVEIYQKAIELVHDKLADQADIMRKEIRERR